MTIGMHTPVAPLRGGKGLPSAKRAALLRLALQHAKEWDEMNDTPAKREVIALAGFWHTMERKTGKTYEHPARDYYAEHNATVSDDIARISVEYTRRLLLVKLRRLAVLLKNR
jgi:hypothetical protein